MLYLLCTGTITAGAQEAEGPLMPGFDPDALTLEAATHYALAHNPELQAMGEEVAMAEANLRLARAADEIQASVNAYLSTATTPNMVTSASGVMPDDMRMIEPGERLAGDVRVTRSLSSGGRIGASIRQRGYLLAATQADLDAVRLEVWYETRTAYRMVLLRRMLLEVRRRDVEARQELLRVDEIKLETGKIPLYYVLRDRTALAQAQQELTNEQRDLELAMYELAFVLGLDQPRALTLTDALGYQPVDQDETVALQAAAAQGPELAAVRARLEAAEAEIGAARAAYRPQFAVALILDYMVGGDEGSAGGSTAALVGSLPLSDGGARSAEVAMAQSRERGLAQRERQIAQSIAREVLTALANLRAAYRNLGTALEALASAEEDYRVARLRYDAGMAINLEPLDALAALAQAGANQAQAIYEYNNAVDDLQRATGRVVPAEASEDVQATIGG